MLVLDGLYEHGRLAAVTRDWPHEATRQFADRLRDLGGRGRVRWDCRTLPSGSKAAPVTTDVATRSRNHPHTRAHSTIAPAASHGPLPWREYTAGCPPVPSRCTAAQRHNHPHKWLGSNMVTSWQRPTATRI
jgi:hypothetical protein